MKPPEFSGDEFQSLTKFWGTMTEPSPDYYPRKEGELEPQGLPFISEGTLEVLLGRFNLDGRYEDGVRFVGPDKEAHPNKLKLIVAQEVYHSLGLIEVSRDVESGFLDSLGAWVDRSFTEKDARDSAAVGASVVLLAFSEQVPDFYNIIENVPESIWGDVFNKMSVNPAEAKSLIRRNKKAYEIPLFQTSLRNFFDKLDPYIYSPEESMSTRRGAEGMYGALEVMWEDYLRPQVPQQMESGTDIVVEASE